MCSFRGEGERFCSISIVSQCPITTFEIKVATNTRSVITLELGLHTVVLLISTVTCKIRMRD